MRDPASRSAVPGTVVFLLLAALVAWLPGCGPGQNDESVEQTALRVGDEVVGPDSMRRFLLREVGLPPEEIAPEALPTYRRELTAQVLFARAAVEEGLTPDPQALAEEEQLVHELSPDTDPETLRAEARRTVLAHAYEREVIAAGVEVTDEEVEARLGTRPKEEGSSAVFRQIVVADEEAARNAFKRIAQKNESFEAVAREVSSGPERGALQQVPLAHLPDDVLRTLRRTREGTVSRPIELDDAWYLFELQALNRHPDPARRREREEVRRRLFREKLDAMRRGHLEELAARAGVTLPPAAEPGSSEEPPHDQAQAS